jgi:hypothetical protein
MSTRAQNERKFGRWEELPGGGRRYWLEVSGRSGRRACYRKEVDAAETTLRFWQEIYDPSGQLIEIHEKFPVDNGHQGVQGMTMRITKQTVADQIAAYLRHEITSAQLVDWSERSLLEGELAEAEAAVISPVLARLGVADVRSFGLAWEDCEDLLRRLGFAPRVEVVAAS